jgi:gamma-glutamyltranspeptidase/glutathione hydrolase
MALEYAYDNSTVSYLQSLGHNVTRVAPGASYAQMIRRLSDGSFEVATDPRLANAGGYIL